MSFSIFSNMGGYFDFRDSLEGEFIISTINFTSSGSKNFTSDIEGSGRVLSCIIECIEDPLTNLPAYTPSFSINSGVVSWYVDTRNAATHRITVRAI